MATYTVTKVLRRPNTSTEWPGDKYGYTGYNDLRDKVTITSSISADELPLQIWVLIFPRGRPGILRPGKE